ncbi:ankyrin repeat domain-containing protein [Helicobacter sp. 23-1044]
MKRIQRILLAFMLGVLSIQVVWADKNADLIYESLEGNLAKVKSLVEQGADVNAKTDNGNTALTLAKTKAIKEVLRNAR